jgi:hypothetical protein
MDSDDDSQDLSESGYEPSRRSEKIRAGNRWQIREVAGKYFAIWVWSIVIGVATTTTFSLTGFSIRSRGGFLSILLVPLFAISALFMLAAWMSVLSFFRAYILPLIFAPDFRVEGGAVRALERAVRFAVWGLAFRLLLSLADLALSASPIGFG